MPPADADAARHALTRLALAHPADLDRWAGAVGAALGLRAAVARALARAVAVEGDGRETRCAVLARALVRCQADATRAASSRPRLGLVEVGL